MHNINLQRLDRMSMAFSMEGRVPFLDLDLVDYAIALPPETKLRGEMEKWILRKAFEGYLPDIYGVKRRNSPREQDPMNILRK
ncbi:asparagine synthase-related protein [Natranaerobius thermophilus]|uniref:asparagine synthase-related protein n=1 Tax=Natranaerobius thermophilus TaxID=375929 RepID=UPI0001668936